MRVNEAKDFLVRQTAEQAEREGVPLSDLEKRMMYFTESEDAVEDPIALNEEFEAECDTPEYEKKIAGLTTRAYKRLKKEDPDRASIWDDAVRELDKGDHYISLMLPTWRRETVGWVVWKTVQVSLLFVVAGQLLIGFIKHYDLTIFFQGRLRSKRNPCVWNLCSIDCVSSMAIACKHDRRIHVCRGGATEDQGVGFRIAPKDRPNFCSQVELLRMEFILNSEVFRIRIR
jgi:hypothetical protein